MKTLVVMMLVTMLGGCSMNGLQNPFFAYHTDYGQTVVAPEDANPVSSNWYFPLNYNGCVLC